MDVIFFCNQLTGKRNESRPRRPRRLAPRPSRPPCSESVSCILRRLQKQLFVVGNLPRTSARERCRRRRERAGPGRAKERAATSFSSPLSCRVQSGSQLRLLIQGGRDRGPKTKRKTFVNQDVGVSVHLAGNELIRISIFFDLVLPPTLPFTSFSCLPSFPSCSRPSSLSDFVSSEFHMDSQRMKEPNAKGAPKRGRKEKQFLGAPKGGRRTEEYEEGR